MDKRKNVAEYGKVNIWANQNSYCMIKLHISNAKRDYNLSRGVDQYHFFCWSIYPTRFGVACLLNMPGVVKFFN